MLCADCRLSFCKRVCPRGRFKGLTMSINGYNPPASPLETGIFQPVFRLLKGSSGGISECRILQAITF